jgi:hypothetical protein
LVWLWDIIFALKNITTRAKCNNFLILIFHSLIIIHSFVFFKNHWQQHLDFEAGTIKALGLIQCRSLQVYLVKGCCKWTLLIREDSSLFHGQSTMLGCGHAHYSKSLCSFPQVHFLSCSLWRMCSGCLFASGLFHKYWWTRYMHKLQFMMVYSLRIWSHSTGIYISRMTYHRLFR